MVNRISPVASVTQNYRLIPLFVSVFLLVVITATVITFILPETFVGVARVTPGDEVNHQPVATNRTEFAIDPFFTQNAFNVIRSEDVLRRVVDTMNLREEWGRKHGDGEEWDLSLCAKLLNHFIELHLVRNTSLIEIRAHADNPDQAAQLANATAEAYRDYEAERHAGFVKITDRARPNPIPVRPNKPLNITIGIILGLILATLVVGSIAGISSLRQTR